MGWADNIINSLNENGEVSFNPKGNSMKPLINSGDPVVVKKINSKQFKVGDIVLCKVSGKQYLHLISVVDVYNDKYQISNNQGYKNGWISSLAIYGLCVKVKDKPLLTEEDLELRFQI